MKRTGQLLPTLCLLMTQASFGCADVDDVRDDIDTPCDGKCDDAEDTDSDDEDPVNASALDIPINALSHHARQDGLVIPNAFLQSNVRTLESLQSFEFTPEFIAAVEAAALTWAENLSSYTPVGTVTTTDPTEKYLNALFDSLGYIKVLSLEGSGAGHELLQDPDRTKWLELHFREYPAITAYYTIARTLYAEPNSQELAESSSLHDAKQKAKMRALRLDDILYTPKRQQWAWVDALEHWKVFFLDLASTTGTTETPNLGGQQAYKTLKIMMDTATAEFEYEYDDNGHVVNMAQHPLVLAAVSAAYYSSHPAYIDGDDDNEHFIALDGQSAKAWVEGYNRALHEELYALAKPATGDDTNWPEVVARTFYALATLGTSELVHRLFEDIEAYQRGSDEWNWEMTELSRRGRPNDIPRMERDMSISAIRQDTIEVATAIVSGYIGIGEAAEAGVVFQELGETFVSGLRRLTRGIGMFIGPRVPLRIITESEYTALPKKIFWRNEHRYVTHNGHDFPVVETNEGYRTTVPRTGAGEETLWEFDPETRIVGRRLHRLRDGTYDEGPRLLGGGNAHSNRTPKRLTDARVAKLQDLQFLGNFRHASTETVDGMSVLSWDEVETLNEALLKDEAWLTERDKFLVRQPNGEDVIAKTFYCIQKCDRVAKGLRKRGIIAKKHVMKYETPEGQPTKWGHWSDGEFREWNFHVVPVVKVRGPDGVLSDLIIDARYPHDGRAVYGKSEWERAYAKTQSSQRDGSTVPIVTKFKTYAYPTPGE